MVADGGLLLRSTIWCSRPQKTVEEAFAHVTTRLDTGRAGEEGTSDVCGVLVERVVLRQPPLDSNKLLMGIALESHKEEAGIDLSCMRVIPIVVGVTTTEDVLP